MNKYNIGDIVYKIGYSLIGPEHDTKKLTIFKMEITEIIKDKKGIVYKTDIKTGLENDKGGYFDFYNLNTIKDEVDKFIGYGNNKNTSAFDDEFEAIEEMTFMTSKLLDFDKELVKMSVNNNAQNISKIKDKLNQLIRNQKKIIEKLGEQNASKEI